MPAWSALALLLALLLVHSQPGASTQAAASARATGAYANFTGLAATAHSRRSLASKNMLSATKCMFDGNPGECKLNVYYLYWSGMPARPTPGQR